MTAKRIFDFVFSVIALMVLAPVLLIVFCAIRLTSPGPAIFRQERMGRYGRIFTIYKFRTLFEGTGKEGVDLVLRNDLRLTPIGRLLRMTYLDELLQFWNVLKGDMSVVGPRPIKTTEARILIEQKPEFARRFELRPGITGWAKVLDTTGKKMDEVLADLVHDIYYIEHRSFWFDLFIIGRTVRVVCSLRGV